jgi:hypothetical protein
VSADDTNHAILGPVDEAPATFEFRYGALAPLLRLMGTGPRQSVIELTSDTVTVKMGWAFRASIPRSAIRDAVPAYGPVSGIGVHGSKGRWLVNGSGQGLVTLHIDPSVRARVTGWPVTLRELILSLQQPDQFIVALTSPR